MTDNKKNIEDLFRDAAENYQPVGDTNWDAISAATGRKLFLQFNFRVFNVYYLIA